MAIVSGPLMSLDARGKFANALVFTAWKGRSVVRQLVTPANPYATDQVAVRNQVRTTGAAQSFAYRSIQKGAGRLVTDLDAIKAVTPSGQAWNGTLVKAMIGADSLTYTAAQAAFALLSAPEKAAWDAAAILMTPDIPSVAQGATGGGFTTSLSGGNVMFIYQYGLYSLGIASIPGAVPPTYA